MSHGRTIATVSRPVTDRLNATTFLAAGALAVVAALSIIAGGAAVFVLLRSGAWALLWLLAGWGLGWPLRRWLTPAAGEGLAAQAAFGISAMLLLDNVLGRLGVLQIGGGMGAWVVVVLGLLVLAEQYRRWLGSDAARPTGPANHLLWLALPPVVVLLLAACSAPGWLWSSEFGGYDALSYHLQLPKAWWGLGHVGGLEQNVYSHLPSFVEAGYYHLDVLIGDPVAAAPACQLLHTGMTLLSTAVAYRVARQLSGPIAGAASALLVLGTPWTIVVGSLAYNEMAVGLFLGGGLLVVLDDATRAQPVRRGIAVGLLAGAACGAKLTAVGFAAVPLGLVLLLTSGSVRRAVLAVTAAAIMAFVTVLPWLAANLLETGNPLFPFATGVFGLGHWTAQQAETFRAAHQSDLGFSGRLGQFWDQILRYGMGASPDPTEPWQPQWSLLPWLVLAGGFMGVVRSRLRPAAWRLLLVLIVQSVFWLGFTHLKSRFMVPAVVPGSILGGLLVAAAGDLVRSPRGRTVGIVVLAMLLLVHVCVPAMVFVREREGQPLAGIGASEVFTGEAHADALARPGLTAVERRELLASAPATLWINHLLGDEAQVLCVGVATPFYHEPGRSVYQTTWDRGPMSRVMRESRDDPGVWFCELRREGFTHLLVDPAMLERWERSSPPEGGWNDPLITAERIVGAAERYAEPVHRFSGGAVLYRLSIEGGKNH